MNQVYSLHSTGSLPEIHSLTNSLFTWKWEKYCLSRNVKDMNELSWVVLGLEEIVEAELGVGNWNTFFWNAPPPPTAERQSILLWSTFIIMTLRYMLFISFSTLCPSCNFSRSLFAFSTLSGPADACLHFLLFFFFFFFLCLFIVIVRLLLLRFFLGLS